MCDVSIVVYCTYGWCGSRGECYKVLGKGLELLTMNGGRFEINQQLFADDTALVADSEEKLYRLVW